MTIGVGFNCKNGVVFCSDSQITVAGGLKYNEKKILTIEQGDHSLAFCYAGSPEIMKLFYEKMSEEFFCYTQDLYILEPFQTGSYWNETVRGKAEQALQEIYKKHGKSRQLELLFASYSKNFGVSFYRASMTLIRQAALAEAIGVGDSSILRFLADLFVRSDMSIQQALVLGCYMVAKAKTYIDGVGGPTQAFFMTDSGKMRSMQMDVWEEPSTLLSVESGLSDLMYAVTKENKSREELNIALDKFRHSLDVSWPWAMEYSDPEYFS
jgi:20S proteasome alpha/beta subunit